MNLLFLVSWRGLKCILKWKTDRFNPHVTSFERTHISLLPSLKSKKKIKEKKMHMKCAKKQLKDQHVGQQRTTCECGSLKMHMHVMIWKKIR